MTHCSPGILDNATRMTGAGRPLNIYSTTHFSKDCRGKECSLENNTHGKTTFTSFLLGSSQIIGSDEESIENSVLSWEKNLKQHSEKPSKYMCSKNQKVVGNHHRIFKKLLNLATYGNLHSFSNIFWLTIIHIKFTKQQTFPWPFQITIFTLQQPNTERSHYRGGNRYGEAKKVTYGYSHA